MRRIDDSERRARLALRHRLAAPADAPEQVAADLIGLHSTDPASVFLAARARTRDGAPARLERALYDDRTLVRILGMRRTVFVVPVDLAPVVQAACSQAIAARERKRLLAALEQAAIAADAGKWLAQVEKTTVRALAARGDATAAELGEDVVQLREQVVYSPGKKWETRMTVSSRLLFLLAAEGRIVRGRPRGSWSSTQYRWAPADAWFAEPAAEWSAEDARVELARLWLAAYGPATAADLKWWTGWTAGGVNRALARIGPAEVALDGGVGLALADDLEPPGDVEPWAALLPALDPTVMGWAAREWYLGPHGPALFDRTGNAGPTVWWDGRVVGGWAQRDDGEVAVRLLEDLGADAVAAVEAEAQALGRWLGDVRLAARARARTPLERELLA
jgi:Winged helix DNA-binding domain